MRLWKMLIEIIKFMTRKDIILPIAAHFIVLFILSYNQDNKSYNQDNKSDGEGTYSFYIIKAHTSFQIKLSKELIIEFSNDDCILKLDYSYIPFLPLSLFSFRIFQSNLDDSYGFDKRMVQTLKNSSKKLSFLKLEDKTNLWISFSSNKPYFIKIGYAYQLENNVLFEFETFEQKGINLLKEILPRPVSSFYFKIKENSIINKGILFNPPFILNGLNPVDNLMVQNLPENNQKLYAILKKIKLTNQDIDEIIDLMRTEKNKKKLTVCLGPSKFFLSAKYKIFLEIYSKDHSDPIAFDQNIYGVYKIVHGSFKVKWFNSLHLLDDNNRPKQLEERLIDVDKFLWFTPDIFNIYQLRNTHNDYSIILKAIFCSDYPNIDLTNRLSFYNESEKVIKNYSISFDKEFNGSCKFNFPQTGKGTMKFKIKPLSKEIKSFYVRIGIFRLIFNTDSGLLNFISIENSEELGMRKVQSQNLNHFVSNVILWVSFSAFDPLFIKIGYGNLMQNNTIVDYRFNQSKDGFKMLKKIKCIEFDPILIESYLLQNPEIKSEAVIIDPSPLIINNEGLSFKNLNENHITVSDLPKIGQILYNKISGNQIALSDRDIEAIYFSLENQNCLLNEKLINSQSNQILIALHKKFDRTPEYLFFLEIWPKGYSSPIYNHVNRITIIKMLHGSLYFEYFNPLDQNYSNEKIQPISSANFEKNNITWIGSEYYHTYRITNKSTMTYAITIKSCSSSDYDEFENHNDLDFFSLIDDVRKEYDSKNCDFSVANLEQDKENTRTKHDKLEELKKIEDFEIDDTEK